MPQHDFSALFKQYPAVIAQMPAVFTSHQFIQGLAQRNQALYVEALYDYRDAVHRGAPAPFMMVHSILARRLSAHPELAEGLRDVPSCDIFGRHGECAGWHKHQHGQYRLPGLRSAGGGRAA
jgi:hypothetical protein